MFLMKLTKRFDVDEKLERFSKVIPDSEIDLKFPKLRPRKIWSTNRGRRKIFSSSQLYRMHLVTLLKHIFSFNRLFIELKQRRLLRKFCNILNKYNIPNRRIFFEFRKYLKEEGFVKIKAMLLNRLLKILPLPQVIIGSVDSTDIEASCYGFRKKSVIALVNVIVQENILRKKQQKELVQRNQEKVYFSLDTRNTRSGLYLERLQRFLLSHLHQLLHQQMSLRINLCFL